MAYKPILIQITDEHMNLNLGGILKMYDQQINEKKITSATIDLANSTLHGNFTIPYAIGFSTPASLLKGGRISLMSGGCYCDSNTFMDQFTKWIAIFSTTGTRIQKTQIVTHDKLSCAICQNNYKIDDKIFQVDNCGHICHLDCFNRVSIEQCELCKQQSQKIQQNIAFHQLHTSIQLNNTIICPVCHIVSRF